ncbi:MAG: class I SAM-dependent methyltransferase [Flammeovirgaceae bacterium]|jgi:O-methyltransferase|nr:class I SAM-dependent methyltransferase [Flammeovirgaceae bacterium]|tara:strand:+ start:8038 stop:8778 length:741 start_codon:yes stop_codon:yes gene_type:complete
MYISWYFIINSALILLLLFLGYQYLESHWSYKINKPFAWEQAIANNLVDPRLTKLERTFRDRVRFYNLWFQIERLKRNKIKGAFAELGVHQGNTAKAIHLMDQTRPFFLFDTFKGFDERDLEKEQKADHKYSTTNFADTDIEQVRLYVGGNENIIFREGYFPETTFGLENQLFALVHLDADLYVPTLEALNFFYPRLSGEGVIIIHDYNHNWDGIPLAVNDFIDKIPESLIAITDWQGSVMIIKNS